MRNQCRNGLRGQQANSPGQRPGCKDVGKFALKGQKPYLVHYAFVPSGRWLRTAVTPGAMPRAICFLAFQAVIVELAKVE